MRVSYILRSAVSVACVAGTAKAAYVIKDTFDSSNFFNEFNFFDGADPTHGFVSYAAAPAANKTALAGYTDNAVYLGVDHTTVSPTGGRGSVRVTSNKAYTKGLFIADIAHMPDSTCGVWPAFWTLGTGDWPANGEIDIIEGVNKQTTNAVTLHTSAGCNFDGTGAKRGSVLSTGNCNAGNAMQGCSFATADTQSYGTGFNEVGGGVYAMEWTSTGIKVWFFTRNAIPADITSSKPDPATWGAPVSSFSGGGCNIDQHFSNHNIIFDTTFCGDWAGQVWSSGSCASLAPTCNDYVAKNPDAFAKAYWTINSVKVYQTGAAKREVSFIG